LRTVNYGVDVHTPNPLAARWVVVASLGLISFLIGGSGIVAVGLLITPLMSEFGWPNGVTSGAATAFTLAILLAAPGAGSAIDKFGARPVMALGVLATSGGFLLVSHCHTPAEMLTAFAIVGIGYSTSFYVPVAVVVSNWMGSRRALGMGIVLGATSIGAALFSLVVARWIESYGWRLASDVLAFLVALMFPVTLLTIRTRPFLSEETHVAASNEVNPSLVKGALLSRTFVVATTSSALFAIGLNGIYYHLVPLLMKAGYPTHSAGLALGASWLFTAVGSLGCGVVADRLGAKMVFAGALLCCATSTLFLLGVATEAFGVFCVLAFVILWGATANSVTQFIPVMFAERFGCSDLGTLIGVQSLLMGIAGAVAPVTTGLLYDRFRDYGPAICLSASATFLAFVVLLFIDEPKRREAVTR
jgi:MFS family permease